MANEGQLIAEAARRHGLGEGAVRVLWEALVAGGGRQAQFSHPDLGGMGQWSGGMAQIGDMVDTGLKTRVAAVCADLADAAAQDGGTSAPRQDRGPAEPSAAQDSQPAAWWPPELGAPSSTGVQNDSRYAFFPEVRRLAVVEGGRVTVYDTGEHRISGTSQRQGTCSALAFLSQAGPVMLDALRVVGSRKVGRE